MSIECRLAATCTAASICAVDPKGDVFSALAIPRSKRMYLICSLRESELMVIGDTTASRRRVQCGIGIVLQSYGIESTDHARVRYRASSGDVLRAIRVCVHSLCAVGHCDW